MMCENFLRHDAAACRPSRTASPTLLRRRGSALRAGALPSRTRCCHLRICADVCSHKRLRHTGCALESSRPSASRPVRAAWPPTRHVRRSADVVSMCVGSGRLRPGYSTSIETLLLLRCIPDSRTRLAGNGVLPEVPVDHIPSHTCYAIGFGGTYECQFVRFTPAASYRAGGSTPDFFADVRDCVPDSGNRF